MIHLEFFKPEDLSGVSYALDENQMRFTATAQQALQSISERDDNDAFPVTIFYNDLPAGFFVLDFGKDKLEITDNENSTLLRSLSVNPGMQGKGIGKAAMKLYWPSIRKTILLTIFTLRQDTFTTVRPESEEADLNI